MVAKFCLVSQPEFLSGIAVENVQQALYENGMDQNENKEEFYFFAEEDPYALDSEDDGGKLPLTSRPSKTPPIYLPPSFNPAISDINRSINMVPSHSLFSQLNLVDTSDGISIPLQQPPPPPPPPRLSLINQSAPLNTLASAFSALQHSELSTGLPSGVLINSHEPLRHPSSEPIRATAEPSLYLNLAVRINVDLGRCVLHPRLQSPNFPSGTGVTIGGAGSSITSYAAASSVNVQFPNTIPNLAFPGANSNLLGVPSMPFPLTSQLTRLTGQNRHLFRASGLQQQQHLQQFQKQQQPTLNNVHQFSIVGAPVPDYCHLPSTVAGDAAVGAMGVVGGGGSCVWGASLEEDFLAAYLDRYRRFLTHDPALKMIDISVFYLPAVEIDDNIDQSVGELHYNSKTELDLFSLDKPFTNDYLSKEEYPPISQPSHNDPTSFMISSIQPPQQRNFRKKADLYASCSLMKLPKVGIIFFTIHY
ncbi:unnamed protein product [Protopolystoma xenopodis]|uniref:Uncharacterized protein n=1 Tax=Protopolystoma xenopodis TaxID=117903 RepID=A0A3S5BRA7_9PLAT|nr:unnamed protein product [Protopolystoma xenopodis]